MIYGFFRRLPNEPSGKESCEDSRRPRRGVQKSTGRRGLAARFELSSCVLREIHRSKLLHMRLGACQRCVPDRVAGHYNNGHSELLQLCEHPRCLGGTLRSGCIVAKAAVSCSVHGVEHRLDRWPTELACSTF